MSSSLARRRHPHMPHCIAIAIASACTPVIFIDSCMADLAPRNWGHFEGNAWKCRSHCYIVQECIMNGNANYFPAKMH